MASSSAANATKLTDAKRRKEVLETLAKFSQSTYTAQSSVEYHTPPPAKISLPEGMTLEQASKVTAEAARAEAEKQDFKHTFKARPHDGANALQQILMKYFGSSGRGIPIRTFFGDIPPSFVEVEVDYGVTAQVPWGHIEVALFEGHMELGATRDSEYGVLFQLTVNAPKRLAASIHGFFNLIEDYLKEHSIYKGKSIIGTEQPKFLRISPNPTIVYNDDVTAGLQNTVWGVIENAELLKADNRRRNLRVLLHGPYGTGKSECGNTTAQVANDNGWTFIQFKSGKESIEQLENTMKTARLLSPAIVFIEDIDIYAKDQDDAAQTRITNLFDGIGSKDDDVMIVMTSNHAASFSKAMLRAGRVDRMIEIGALDRPATEEMIRRVIGSHRIDKETDFDEVWLAMHDYEPAFVRQTFDQAAQAALIRTKTRTYMLTTHDFVSAANLLRPQHDLHRDKDERSKRPTLDTMVSKVVQETLEHTMRIVEDGDPRFGFGVVPEAERVTKVG